MALLDLLGRRWTLRILWELRTGEPIFRELQQRCDAVSSSVLSSRLRELGEAGIVAHTGRGYALTPAGRELLAMLRSLNEWADRWQPAPDIPHDAHSGSAYARSIRRGRAASAGSNS